MIKNLLKGILHTLVISTIILSIFTMIHQAKLEQTLPAPNVHGFYMMMGFLYVFGMICLYIGLIFNTYKSK